MMQPAEAATEHLKAIRALMERATIYRAISAPTALVGGVLAVGLGFLLMSQETVSVWTFLWAWLAVLVVVSVLNFALLHRGAKKRGEPFISSGMKHAMRAVAPPLLAGFVLSVVLACRKCAGGCLGEIAALWTLCYGLALLATGAFAPRSMQLLGGACFGAGLAAFALAPQEMGAADLRFACGTMAVSFGLFHLAYGAGVLLFNKRDSASTPNLSA